VVAGADVARSEQTSARVAGDGDVRRPGRVVGHGCRDPLGGTHAHTAYLSAIGVQLALLAAFAVDEAVRLRRAPGRAGRLVLPTLTVVQPSWCVVLAVVTGMPRPLWIAMIGVTAGMCALVVASALRTPWRRRLGRTIALAAAVAVLAGPALFAVQVVDAARDGSGETRTSA
jgi:hypothetical protein